MKSKGKLANTLFFLSLLCIFVIGSVLVVSYQIIGYKNIVSDNEIVDSAHTPLAYVQNKVRLYDYQGGISTMELDDVDVLVLHDKNTNVYIYQYKGFLCELYAIKDYEVNLSDGDRLFSVDSFTFETSENKIDFIVEVQGIKQHLQIKFMSEGVIV